MSHGALNHSYVLDEGVALTGRGDPAILDYGCGAGGVVALGKARGLNVVGADTYAGPYASYLETLAPELAGSILPMEGRLPFPDQSFDLVVANQVFEHVADLRDVVDDIARVLKPNGVLLSLFPVRETWYEGHVGLYFAHWLQSFPAAQRRYLMASHRCGLGLDRLPGQGSRSWADSSAKTLRDTCYYRSAREARDTIEAAIGARPIDLSASYISYRLRHSRLKNLVRLQDMRLARAAFSAVAHVRAGTVLATTKPSAAGPTSAHPTIGTRL
jgi:SAM-dependent methyltransferase